MSKLMCFILAALFFTMFADCAGAGRSVKIKLLANESVGDRYKSEIAPDSGVVREASRKYSVYLPLPGMHGRYKFKFAAVAEGEAEITIRNYFRGQEPPLTVAVYTAVVDKKKRLTLTERNVEEVTAQQEK